MNLLFQVMSQRVRSSEDCRKALTIVPSRANSSSSDDDTISVARTLQRRFDQGGNDTTPLRGIHIAHRTRFSGDSQRLISVLH